MALSWAFCICLEAGQGEADRLFLTEVIPQGRVLRGAGEREKVAQAALKSVFAFAGAHTFGPGILGTHLFPSHGAKSTLN